MQDDVWEIIPKSNQWNDWCTHFVQCCNAPQPSVIFFTITGSIFNQYSPFSHSSTVMIGNRQILLSLSWPNSAHDAGESSHVLYRPVLMQVPSSGHVCDCALVESMTNSAVKNRRWIIGVIVLPMNRDGSMIVMVVVNEANEVADGGGSSGDGCTNYKLSSFLTSESIMKTFNSTPILKLSSAVVSFSSGAKEDTTNITSHHNWHHGCNKADIQ